MSVSIRAIVKMIDDRRTMMGICSGNLYTHSPSITTKLIEQMMETGIVWLLFVSIFFQQIRNALSCFTSQKHKYGYPLDNAMRAQLEGMGAPYPKRAGSADSGTADHQSAGGGASPTSALCGAH